MLSQRQLNILSLIIQHYTATGQPVGSKRLMDEGIQASSATIRNDMVVLEELGLIEKTHSSSGRVPSLYGYRYYVDHLLTPVAVDAEELSVIRSALQKNVHEIKDIVEQSAEILSKLTSYTAFSLGPEAKERTLTGFRLVPLNNRQVMAIIVTDQGNAENQVFTIPSHVSSEDLEMVIRIINDKLVGQPLLTVYHKLRTEIPLLLQKYFQTTAGMMDVFDGMLSHAFEDQVYVGGRLNLLDFNALQDVHQLKSVYSLMENREELTSLLAPQTGGIEVRIGTELGNKMLEGLSLITATYEINGHGRGTIALMGPTSMPYSKMVGLVEAFQSELTKQLTAYYKSLDSPNKSF